MEWWVTCLVLIFATLIWLRKAQSKLQVLSAADLITTGPDTCVFFNSPQAQAIAQLVVEEGSRRGVACDLQDLSSIDEAQFRRLKVALLVIDYRAENFRLWLEGLANHRTSLSGLRFSIFSLNDGSSAASSVDAGLIRLHAHRLVAGGGKETDLATWLEHAWTALKGEGVRVECDAKYLDCMMHCGETGQVEGDYSEVARQYLRAVVTKVLSTRELKKDPESSTLHIELDAPQVEYQPADNLAVFPENTEELVREIASLQGYDLTAVFKFIPKPDKELPFPTPCSVLTALTRHCDLTGLYSKLTLRTLAEFAAAPEEKEQLLHLASLKGKADYARKVQACMMSVADLFKAFPSVRVPVHLLVQVLPRIQPRFYTLASSARRHPGSMHLTVSVARHFTAEGTRFTGLCSGFLERMHLTKLYRPVRVYLKRSVFAVPRSPVPLWMICNGSGVAPFRGILQELDCLRERNQ
jgi:sulfite reductase alpha subunit-like flavoprotein